MKSSCASLRGLSCREYASFEAFLCHTLSPILELLPSIEGMEVEVLVEPFFLDPPARKPLYLLVLVVFESLSDFKLVSSNDPDATNIIL